MFYVCSCSRHKVVTLLCVHLLQLLPLSGCACFLCSCYRRKVATVLCVHMLPLLPLSGFDCFMCVPVPVMRL